MAYVVQQRDIDLLFQSSKSIYSKVELLNRDFKVIDSIEGNLIKDSFSISSESNIRRIYSCELMVHDSSFQIGKDKKIWIDRYLRPYIGIKYLRTNETVWYSLGTYVFNDTNYNYDETNKTLSLSCSDLMCTLNGDCDGNIQGLSTKIEAGSYIRNVIIALLNEVGITKYRVEDVGKNIPYDLEYSVGSNYYQILKEIVDLYAGYEMFFDLDGTFIIQKIPTTKNEISVLDEQTFTQLFKSENKNNTFNNIYNVTQVWGSVIETDYYTQISSFISPTYIVSINGVTELENFAKYGIRFYVTNGNNPSININSLGIVPIVDEDGNSISSGRLKSDTDYVFKYRRSNNTFLLLGQYQAYGEYKCYDTDCPFSITNLGYEITQVLQFEELESDDLCSQRAKYETWLSTRFQDKLNLKIVAIPFLDVNWKVTYRSESGEVGDYIVKSINGSSNEFTMDVSMIKYSELYPDIV